MSCLFALELVVSAVGVLNLDGYVTDLKFFSTDLADLLEYELGLLFCYDMAAQSDLVVSQGPHMQVVHIHFLIASFHLLYQFVQVNYWRSAFH